MRAPDPCGARARLRQWQSARAGIPNRHEYPLDASPQELIGFCESLLDALALTRQKGVSFRVAKPPASRGKQPRHSDAIEARR